MKQMKQFDTFCMIFVICYLLFIISPHSLSILFQKICRA